MWRQWQMFWSEGLWQERPERGRFRRWGVGQLRLILLVWDELSKEKIWLHAHALTYTTLLALIPLLALILSAFQGFGRVGNMLQDKLRPWLMRNLVPETGKSVYTTIESMVNKINFESLGIIGVLGVIYTALKALGRTEDAFNEIMYTKRSRSMLRRFSMYWSMLTLGPLLLGASFSLQATVMNSALIQRMMSNSLFNTVVLQLTSVLLTCLAFWLAYKFVPAGEVHWMSSLLGALVAGLTWEFTRQTYYLSLSGSFRWHTIYGTLAVLPVTLIWLYLTWLIVLSGAAITFCHQHLATLAEARNERPLSHRYQERLGCAAMLLVARSFVEGQPAITVEEVAGKLGISPALADSLLEMLEQGGFAVPLQGKDDNALREQAYQPARELSAVSLRELVIYIRERGHQDIPLPNAVQEVERLLAPAEEAMRDALGNYTLRDILDASPRAEPESLASRRCAGLDSAP